MKLKETNTPIKEFNPKEYSKETRGRRAADVTVHKDATKKDIKNALSPRKPRHSPKNAKMVSPRQKSSTQKSDKK